MSSNHPNEPSSPSEPHGENEPAGQPEYLGTDAPASPVRGRRGAKRSGKKWAVLGIAAVAVAGVVGAGAWAAATLLPGGELPSTAIPANAVGYVSVDLDPSATQKIEAIKTLKKFPGLDKELNLGSRDDLRRWFFEKVQEGGDCKALDYGKDIEPWLGDRIAMAAVPAAKNSVTPVVAVQVSDQEAARTGFAKIAACANQDKAETGMAFSGDYMLVSDSQQHAQSFATASQESSLADDADFQGWMDKVGDPGVVTMYASKDAVRVLGDLEGKGMNAFEGGSSSMSATSATSFEGSATNVVPADTMGEIAKDFKGMAGVVRFQDGAIEAEYVGGGVPQSMAPAVGASGPAIGSLPDTTGVAFSLALRDGWFTDYLKSMSQVFGGGGPSVDDMLKEAEAQTGLQLPQDIETMLGNGVSMSLDSSLDVDKLMKTNDPTQVPLGVRIKGDPDKIMPVLDKLKTRLGPVADGLVVRKADGGVALGMDSDYVDKLVAGGNLADAEAFTSVVPDADKASGVFFLNFDAGDGWADRIADRVSNGDPQVTGNIAPLHALGISAWADADNVQHGLFRLSTD